MCVSQLVSSNDVNALEWMGENCGFKGVGSFGVLASVSIEAVQGLWLECILHNGLLTDVR
jgi:hypothetical protein